MRFVTDLNKGILGQPDSQGLWQEIIGHIPDSVLLKKNVKILNVACGHLTEANILARRMLALGRTRSEIKKSMYVLDKYRVFTNAAKMQGYTNVICEDFLEWDTNMKFDVIVGNPPYVDASGGNIPLYDKFVEKVVDLSQEIICLIIPSSCAVSDERNGNKVRNAIYNEHTKKIKFLDNSTFENADVETLYFVLNKKKIFDPIIEFNEAYQVKYRPNSFVFKDKILHNILTKCNSITSTESWIKFNRIDKTKETTKKRKTVTLINSDEIEFSSENIIDPYVDSHKVVTSFLPNSKNHLDVVWPVKAGIAVKAGYTISEVESYDQAVNLSLYLKSNLCKCIHNRTKTSRSLRTPQIKFIPKIDINKRWTDKAIYKHFGLSAEEISYVESHVK